MKFCKECGSLYFLRKKENKEDGNVTVNLTDGSESVLIHECRNCGFTEEWEDTNKCVYNSDLIKNDYMAYHASMNPYTIKDPTLPRLSNIRCINKRCLTNTNNYSFIIISPSDFEKDSLSLTLKEIVTNLFPTRNWDIIYSKLDMDEIDEHGELHTLCGKIIKDTEKKIIKENELNIKSDEYEHVIITDSEQLITDTEFNDVVNELVKLSNDEDNLYPFENKDGIILTKILREVISIKYDDINMKYMYICSTCGSSWKNIN